MSAESPCEGVIFLGQTTVSKWRLAGTPLRTATQQTAISSADWRGYTDDSGLAEGANRTRRSFADD
jgi:hypothetical protein